MIPHPFVYDPGPVLTGTVGNGMVSSNALLLENADGLFISYWDANDVDVTGLLVISPVGTVWKIVSPYDTTQWIEFTQTDGASGQADCAIVPMTASGMGNPIPAGSMITLENDYEPVTVEPPLEPELGRPTVKDVALLLRARTKDSGGHEVGTFDDDTRPTAADVEEQIDAAVALVGTRLPPIDTLAASLVPAVSSLVAYRAAMRIEKSYFPEQVRTDRSAYDQLRQEYLDDLAALLDTLQAGGGATGGEEPPVIGYMACLPIGSWTSIGTECIQSGDATLAAAEHAMGERAERMR